MKLYNELSEYYFSIEESHRDFNNDIALVRSLLHNIQMPVLLDLGCGTGEHLNPLNKYGIKCVGIDISNSMLNIARSRFPKKIEFIKGDMRKLDYYNDFDIIISLFGSFNYLLENSEIEKTLWNAWRSLKAEGIGLFEVWNSYPIEKISQKELTHISTIQYKGKTIKRNRGFNLLSQSKGTIVEVNYEYIITENISVERVNDRHVMRTFTKDEITAFLEDNGFTIINIYSNTLKNPYNLLSNKMVIHFQKK